MPAVNSRGRGRRTISEINMVPFIDVMLVLLIIFMVTAPLITPKIIEVPTVGKAPVEPPKPIFVQIDKDEKIQITAPGGKPIIVSFSEVGSTVKRLQPAVPQGEKTSPVVIIAFKSSNYEPVVKVMDALKSARVERVSLSVQTLN
jgi:biopolymer transport protein TolR